MKKLTFAFLLLTAFCLLPAATQAQGTTSYPTSVDTATTLPSPVDNKFTAVASALTNSATTATVVSTTGFPAAGIIVIESEQIAYTGTTSTTFTGLTRGFGGSSAVAHAVNATVKVLIVSAHVTGVRGAAVGLESKVGIGSSDASSASTGDVLTKKSDGTTYWHAVTGGGGGIGDVVGPLSAVNNRIAVFDGPTGKLLKDGGNVIADLQPIDSDLTAIAALTPSNDDIIQRKSGAWTNRTIAQLKTDLSLSGSNTGDQTITLTGDVTGSGTGSFATAIGSGKVTNTMLAGSIVYSKLNLTGAILNADLAGSIAYSKLSLTGAILNADLAGSIAASKLVGTDIATVGTVTSGTWSATAIAVTKGGTALTSLAQGDLIYGSASNTFSALAKSTSSTRYLSNTGTSNNPAWAQVDLTNGVTGTLPVGNGGTGITSLGSGVGTWLGTPSSSNLRGALTDENGTGAALFDSSTSAILITPAITTSATLTRDSLSTTSTDGLIVTNTTTGSAQNSPRIRLHGRSSVSDNATDWIIETRGTASGNSDFWVAAQTASGGYTDLFGVRYNGASGNPQFNLNAPSGHNFNLSFMAGGAFKWYMRNRGDTSDQFTLMNSDVSGNVEKFILSQAGALQLPNYGAGTATFDASGNLTAVSDERRKRDIRPFTRGLDDLVGINPILHGYTPESHLDQTRDDYAGFSAQNVLLHIPEAVGRDQEGYYTLSDRPIIAALVNAVKELKAEIEAMKAQWR